VLGRFSLRIINGLSDHLIHLVFANTLQSERTANNETRCGGVRKTRHSVVQHPDGR